MTQTPILQGLLIIFDTNPNFIVAFWDCLLLIPMDNTNNHNASNSIHNQTELYGYNSSVPLALVQECDGLRILTAEKNEFLQVLYSLKL